MQRTTGTATAAVAASPKHVFSHCYDDNFLLLLLLLLLLLPGCQERLRSAP
jgi:hypothetical protein